MIYFHKVSYWTKSYKQTRSLLKFTTITIKDNFQNATMSLQISATG